MKAKTKTTKQPDVPNAGRWVASKEGPPGTKPRLLFLECERWVDARRAARTVLGNDLNHVVRLDGDKVRRVPMPRVQVRWQGNAAGVSTLRLQTRQIDRKGKASDWVDL